MAPPTRRARGTLAGRFDGERAVALVHAVDVTERRETRPHLFGGSIDADDDALARPEAVRQLGGGPFGDQRAAGQHDHALAERFHLGEDVAREEHRPRAAQAADELADLDHLRGIEPDRRLVEHEDRRIAEQRLRQPHALAIALRERADPATRHARQAERREHGVDGGGALCPLDALRARDESQVLDHAQLGIVRRVLREVADGAAAGERIALQVVAGDPDRTLRRREDAGHDAHGRGLAGTVRTEEPDDLALVDGERDAANRLHRPEALHHVAHLDHRPCWHGGHG